MKSAITAIVKSLRALKSEGVERIVVADETLAELREILENSPQHADADSQKTRAETSTHARVSTHVSEREISPEPAHVSAPTPAKPAFPPPPKISAPTAGTKTERLDAVRETMLADAVCREHCHAGKKLVFGCGNPDSPVLFCGEAPGAEEETQGEPFVGPAGQLLTKIIAATGLTRDSVYIANIMKWRPEMPTAFGNRPPTPEEMAYCLPFLEAQIEIIRPRAIVALGLTALNGLLGNDPDRKMGAVRGKKFEFRGIPLVPTYHPSYLLRNGTMKSKRLVWEDFMTMMEIIDLPISPKQRGYFLPKM